MISFAGRLPMCISVSVIFAAGSHLQYPKGCQLQPDVLHTPDAGFRKQHNYRRPL